MDSDIIIVFDLDGTLTESKCDIDNEMVDLLKELLKIHRVAIITGGTFEQIKGQVLFDLHLYKPDIKKLYLFPTNGAIFYKCRFNDETCECDWKKEYESSITVANRRRIIEAFEGAFKELNWEHPDCPYGELIEDRGTQITFSALGQEAPIEIKCVYDPSGEKRIELAERLQEFLPDFEVKLGGTTSIDVNKKGINKAFGIRKIAETLNVEEDRIVFVGTETYGKVDSSVAQTNARIYDVNDIEETKQFIRRILNYDL